MDKATEIKLLQQFKGTDSYFTQCFNDHDIDQMCENIKNDFAIESDCQFFAQIAELKGQLRDMKRQHEEEIKRLNDEHNRALKQMCERSADKRRAFVKELLNAEETGEDTITGICGEFIGTLDVIKIKRECGITPTDTEIDHLIHAASLVEEIEG